MGGAVALAASLVGFIAFDKYREKKKKERRLKLLKRRSISNNKHGVKNPLSFTQDDLIISEEDEEQQSSDQEDVQQQPQERRVLCMDQNDELAFEEEIKQDEEFKHIEAQFNGQDLEQSHNKNAIIQKVHLNSEGEEEDAEMVGATPQFIVEKQKNKNINDFLRSVEQNKRKFVRQKIFREDLGGYSDVPGLQGQLTDAELNRRGLGGGRSAFMSEDDEEIMSIRTDPARIKEKDLLQLNPDNFQNKQDYVFFDFLSLYTKKFKDQQENKAKQQLNHSMSETASNSGIGLNQN